MVEIKDLLLRIAKLYAIKDFDAESSVLLAEWVMDEYKHSSFEIVQQALNKPPISKDKTWRLTPETLAEWIDKTRERLVDQRLREESLQKQNSKVEFPEVSNDIDKLINEVKNKLVAEITNDKSERLKTLQEMKVIKKEEDEKVNGRKASLRQIDEQYLIIREKKMESAKARGLDKLGLHELKTFEIEGKIIVCRNKEEAQEIFTEVYL